MGGCAAVTSERTASGSSVVPKNGVSYFLPRGRVVVTLTWNAAVRSWDVAPTVIYEADPNARYNLDWTNFFLSDKDTTVAVDPQTGLLQTLTATSPGQNVNTVSTRIDAAPNLYRLPATVAAVASYDGPGFAPSGAPHDGNAYSATGQVMLDDDQHTEATAFVASPGTNAKLYAAIRVSLVRKFDLGAEFPRRKHWEVGADGKAGGLVARTPIPYELNVEEITSTDTSFQAAGGRRVTYAIAPRILMLPDSRHDFVYRVLSRPLVSDTTRVALSNGMVQSLEQVRPGMFDALLTLPKYVVTNVVPLPVEITQTQQNISNAQSKISTDKAAGSTINEGE